MIGRRLAAQCRTAANAGFQASAVQCNTVQDGGSEPSAGGGVPDAESWLPVWLRLRGGLALVPRTVKIACSAPRRVYSTLL